MIYFRERLREEMAAGDRIRYVSWQRNTSDGSAGKRTLDGKRERSERTYSYYSN